MTLLKFGANKPQILCYEIYQSQELNDDPGMSFVHGFTVGARFGR
jgi:hypothetical protein